MLLKMKKNKTQFYFSFRSPYSWLAWKFLKNVFPTEITILPTWNPSVQTNLLVQEKGGNVLYTNMLKDKHMYIMHDIQRLSKKFEIPLTFPFDEENPDWETVHLSYLYAVDKNLGKEFMDITFEYRWEKGLNIWNIDTIREILKQLNLSTEILDNSSCLSFYQKIASEILYEGYKNGVFGIPFFIIGNSKFWGIERIIPLINRWNEISEENIEMDSIDLPFESFYNMTFDHGGGCG